MHNLTELALHKYLSDVVKGEGHISDDTIAAISEDVSKAVKRQFGRGKRSYSIRMSGVGRPLCQQWYDKNKPEVGETPPTTFVMNMLIGDIVEAVFKGLLKEAGVSYKDSDRVTLQLKDGDTVSGEYDIVIEGKVDDIKSASNWSYNNKFEDIATLEGTDHFGYIHQLVGYSKASGYDIGGWWVINKATGEFKYVEAKGVDVDKVIDDINTRVSKIKENKFEREFEAEEETYYGKPSGNKKLCITCGFCAYKHDCWPTLKYLPSRVYNGKGTPPLVPYVEINDDAGNKGNTEKDTAS